MKKIRASIEIDCDCGQQSSIVNPVSMPVRQLADFKLECV